MGNATTLRAPRVRSLCTLEASSRSMGPRVALGRRGATGAGQKGWQGVLTDPTSCRPRGGKSDRYHPLWPRRSATMYLGSLRTHVGSVDRPGPMWCYHRSIERVLEGGGVEGWVVV